MGHPRTDRVLAIVDSFSNPNESSPLPIAHICNMKGLAAKFLSYLSEKLN